jgi:dolichol-phosphate mannosyltransferase
VSNRESKPTLAVVIPRLWEAECLRQLLPSVRSALTSCGISWEILVVDDDSRDGTEEVVLAAAVDDPRIRLLVRKGERCLSGAILHGWQNTDATILGVMDADLQHPPELLPELIAEALGGTDVVIGSRYTRGGPAGGWNALRKLISSAAVWAALPLQCRNLRVKDPMSGFFLVWRRCVENITFQEAGFKLLLEILVCGRICSVREIPFAFGRRWAGSSKATLKVAWEYFLLQVRLYAIRRRGRRAVEIVSRA